MILPLIHLCINKNDTNIGYSIIHEDLGFKVSVRKKNNNIRYQGISELLSYHMSLNEVQTILSNIKFEAYKM